MMNMYFGLFYQKSKMNLSEAKDEQVFWFVSLVVKDEQVKR